MPRSDAGLHVIAQALYLAVQLDDVAQAQLEMKRLEQAVLDRLAAGDSEGLQESAMGILRHAQRLAAANRQAALDQLRPLPAASLYQDDARPNASWRLDG